jgi:hypothetical protein
MNNVVMLAIVQAHLAKLLSCDGDLIRDGAGRPIDFGAAGASLGFAQGGTLGGGGGGGVGAGLLAPLDGHLTYDKLSQVDLR